MRTPTQTLVSLDRWRQAAPASAASISRRLAGSALTNARRSLQEITTAVQDRDSAHPHLDADAEAGALRRLSREQCLALLATRTTGRFAYIARQGRPDIVPVNYVLDDGVILIRSAPGPKLQAAERREHVAFEVDDLDETNHLGWSVVVTGVAERVHPDDAAHLVAPVPWAHGTRRHVLRIRPIRIDGRELC